MNARFHRSSSARLLSVCIVNLVVGGCGNDDDSKGNKSSNYSPSTAEGKSDGTAGGDLVALQIRQAELLCACAGDADVQALCMDIVWPEGQADCVRMSLNVRASQNTQAFTCAGDAERKGIDCLTLAGCDEDAQGECHVAFSRAVDACPKFDAQTQADGQACGVTDGDFGDDDDEWDDDEWCADADLCDGFEDCADGSDEENCD